MGDDRECQPRTASQAGGPAAGGKAQGVADQLLRRNRYENIRDRDTAACSCSVRVRQDVVADAAAGDGDGQRADEAGESLAKLKNLKERLMKAPTFREA